MALKDNETDKCPLCGRKTNNKCHRKLGLIERPDEKFEYWECVLAGELFTLDISNPGGKNTRCADDFQ